jgi:ribosomal protein S18 acetylase RimI-like enzyme
MMINKENVTVRLVGEKDIPAMTANRLAYLTEMQGERSPEYMQNLERELAAYFRLYIESGSFFALVAESEGQILGYGAMVLRSVPGDLNKPSYLEGDILNMYTLPFARQQGVGRLILEALVAKARSMGLSKIGLHTSKDGEHLYRSYGFNEPIYPYLELVL